MSVSVTKTLVGSCGTNVDVFVTGDRVGVAPASKPGTLPPTEPEPVNCCFLIAAIWATVVASNTPI